MTDITRTIKFVAVGLVGKPVSGRNISVSVIRMAMIKIPIIARVFRAGGRVADEIPPTTMAIMIPRARLCPWTINGIASAITNIVPIKIEIPNVERPRLLR